MSSLDRLAIKGFKSIQELVDFDLKTLNVLIGANGAGKSNFIEFFRMISAMMKPEGLKEFIAGSADAFLFGGPKRTPCVEVQMHFGQNGYDFELAPTDDGFFLINNEQRHYFPGSTTRNLGSGNFSPQLLNDKDGEGFNSKHNASWHTYNAIISWKIYHFHDTSKEAGMRRYNDQAHNKVLFMDGSNIAPFLLNVKQICPDAYSEMINALRLVIPFFDNFILEPDSNEKLRLNWRQKGLKDYPMRPTLLSDGSIRFVCLAAALLQPDPPSTIIIDEPELGLHPGALAILAELIEDASRRTQVIISTQSPALIDHFAINDVIVVSRKNGASTFKRLDEKDFNVWLEEYSVGELWTKDVIGGGPVHE